MNYFIRNPVFPQIHPDLSSDARGFQDSFTHAQSGRVDDARLLEAERPDAVHTYPIRYDNALLPVFINCGRQKELVEELEHWQSSELRR